MCRRMTCLLKDPLMAAGIYIKKKKELCFMPSLTAESLLNLTVVERK